MQLVKNVFQLVLSCGLTIAILLEELPAKAQASDSDDANDQDWSGRSVVVVDGDDPSTWPGGAADAKQAVQNAVDTYDVVLMRGEFQLPVSARPLGSGASSATSILVDRPVVILGQARHGEMARVTGGYFAFVVGMRTPLSGDVVIKHLRFERNGASSVNIRQVTSGARVLIEGNEFVDDLWATFGTADPKALALSTDPFQVALWAEWRSRFFYNPSVKAWFNFSILIGASASPYKIEGDVIVRANYTDPEYGGLPDQFQKVNYSTLGVHSLGISATSHLLVAENTIRNCSSRGLTLLDHLGLAEAINNDIDMGRLDAIELGARGVGISAYYAFFNLGGNNTATVGGTVRIRGNEVSVGSQVGIGIGGQNTIQYPTGTPPIGRTWNEVEMSGNHVALTRTITPEVEAALRTANPTLSATALQSYGLIVVDVSSSKLGSNWVSGDGTYALKVGSLAPSATYPLLTDDNTFASLDTKRFHSVVAAPAPYDGVDVFFDQDAHDNFVERFHGDGQVFSMSSTSGNEVR